MTLKKTFAKAIVGLALLAQSPREEEMRKKDSAPQKQAIAPQNPGA